MPLRNILNVPSGGWRYTQHSTDGVPMKSWSSMGLAYETAAAIADFRKGNGLPRATQREALEDLEEATCLRLHDDPQWCIKKKSSVVRPAVSRPFTNAGRVAVGARVLVEWLGDRAVPVPIAQAQARANVCRKCSQNKLGHSFLKLTADLVRAIAEQMNAKESLKLRVESEEELGTCQACGCVTTLKVHVPLATILANTDDETLNAMPAHCWQQTERQPNP